ncbi:hypothetical protein JRQ81_003438 [Phrynocephalus forsythii]|uniref:C-type lectin domain-containing protein n=1 Tax=Phrynocephalus forsythii TaxID=171643 RepID=A0A9Q0XKK9_9SAUR|nr:hypothetical protein JRQ81_003438 [Phrynocephalus forsythii]
MDSKEECICIYLLVCIIVLVAVLFAFGIIYMDYHLKKVKQQNQSCVCPPVLSGPACPDGWVGYRGKCYNVPDVKKDWPSSQKACSSENASLLTFSHDKEKEFVMRYLYNGTTWLGLSKDPDQLWGWTNGEKSMVPKVTGEGDCVYLNKDGNANAAKCTTELYWICNKPDIFNIYNGS